MGVTDKPVLVVGATGKQGGAAARHLLASGWQVRALVRDTQGAPASRLAAAGARLVRGDMDDTASLAAAMRGVYGVFSVQPTVGSPSAGPAFRLRSRGLHVVGLCGPSQDHRGIASPSGTSSAES